MEARNTVVRALGRHSPRFLTGWVVRRTARLLTGHWRRLPDFLIVGGQRCGTTSLYNYLVEHPDVAPAFIKEVHFFDQHFHKRSNWYRAHFPLATGGLTGEATPYYLFHPCAPQRAFATVPEARLIVLLRDPVERAFSQYYHQVRIGLETLSFEEAIEKEERELAAEQERLAAGEVDRSFLHATYSYLARGVYVDQVQAWLQFFAREQMLILESRRFYNDPASALAQVTAFLGLPAWSPGSYPCYNRGEYAEPGSALRQRLAAYFEPHNRRLYEFLNVDYGWQA